MKIMFKLPVCPYCHTVYRYGKVRKIKSEGKTSVCYHCNKEFRIEKKWGFLVLGLIILVAAVATNLLILNNLYSLNVTPLIVSTVAYIIIGFILVPFFINFKKLKNSVPASASDKNQKQKAEKNQRKK